MTLASEPLLLSLEETARLLKISRGKAYAMASSSSSPWSGWAGVVRVRRDRLEQFLDERSTR